MSANNSAPETGQDKVHLEATVQTVPQNLTTIQNLQTVQSIQSVQSTMASSIQAQVAVGQTTSLVGKSVSLDLNSKLLIKSPIPSNIGSSENSRITGSFCPVDSTVRIITPNVMSTIDRQTQIQQTTQSQQIGTSIPSTYHVPRGPAAVASISTPRATVATPLVRAISTGQPISISRPGTTTTVSTTQWQKTSVVYAQPRHSIPVVNRPVTTSRPLVTAYAGQSQSQTAQAQSQAQPSQQAQQSQPTRLVSSAQVGRSLQATVVTATPSRLMTPVLQAQTGATRLTPQVVTIMPQVSQPGRPVTQTIQSNQTNRPLGITPINRVAVSTPIIGAPNRVATVTSVQTNVGRQLTINTVAGASTGTVSRIVIPPQALQQQQQQQQQQSQQQQGAPRVVQAVTSLANFGQVSRVIATTSSNAGVAGNVTRVAPTGPTSVARITGMSLHPLPMTPTRTTSTPLKLNTQGASGSIQSVQLKQASTTLQPQQQVQQQQQQQQQQQLQQQPQSSQHQQSPVLQRATTSVASQQPASVQGQYLHTPHAATYYSIETSGAYPQYRQTSIQPVRLLVEQGYEEPLTKPNASPRPSILRKRDHDSSPGKGVAKNLVPVLASLPTSSAASPPNSPKGDQDGGGHQSSGSTTVSATSSPGLDEEPEQSRITINPTVEMSPRKKPRKQQLTGVELTESRCTEEEMQFITEEKIKKEVKEEPKDKYGDRKHNSNQQDLKQPQPAPVKSRTAPSLLALWKNRLSTRLNHYRRPSDVRPREERRPTVNEIAQQDQVLQKVNGWKIYHLTSQMEDLVEIEKSVHEKLKATLTMLESQQTKGRQDCLERANDLIKGNMQRSSLISEGMSEAREQLTSIFQHKTYVTDLLQRCGNKRAQKKRDK